ncbi:MAG TPA: amidohydrolase/deacetylase family metallohydrolase [Chloroflexota bacterium]
MTDVSSSGAPISLVVRGGRVLDPASGLDQLADVAVTGSTISDVAPRLSPGGAAELDASGCWVVPGLIDSHTHVYDGVGEMGIDPDEIGVGSGVTTVIDAGSAGWATFDGFSRYVAARSVTRVLALLHFSSIGLAMGSGGCELSDPILLDPGRVAQTIQDHRDVIVGIKVRACRAALRGLGTAPLMMARQVARQIGVPLHVHIGETDPVAGQTEPPSIAEVADLLDAGDVLTHVFTPHPGGVLDERGHLHAAVRAAYDRGVYFDSAHGLKNLSFEYVRRLVDEGIEPWSISTDGHRLNRHGPVYDLPATMTKFMALGFSFQQVVAMTTCNPARAYRLDEQIGSIGRGRVADLTVLRVVDETWQAVDSVGAVLDARLGIEPVAVVRAGRVVDLKTPTRPYGLGQRLEGRR